MSIGKNIRVLRKANGLTQDEFAKMIGKTPQAVSQYERGLNYPSRATIERIAHVLDLRPSDITDTDIEYASVRFVDPREIEMERIFPKLDDGSKDAVLAVARALIRKQD